MIPYSMHQMVSIGGFTILPWLIFQFLIAWPLGFYYLVKESLRRKDIDINDALQLFLVVFLGAVFGARLFYFFGPWPVASSCSGFTFWDKLFNLFSTSSAGWVAYGGIIGALVAGLLFTLIKKMNFWKYADVTAPAAALGFVIARLGCFIAGCCFGSESSSPWAILKAGNAIHPVQLYDSLVNLGMFITLLHLNKKREKEGKFDGYVFLSYIVMYSFFRFFLEFFRGDYGPSTYWFGFTSSQIISVIAFLIAVPLMFYKTEAKTRQRPAKSRFSISARTYALIITGGVLANIGAYIIDYAFPAALVVLVAGLATYIYGIRSIFRK